MNGSRGGVNRFAREKSDETLLGCSAEEHGRRLPDGIQPIASRAVVAMPGQGQGEPDVAITQDHDRPRSPVRATHQPPAPESSPGSVAHHEHTRRAAAPFGCGLTIGPREHRGGHSLPIPGKERRISTSRCSPRFSSDRCSLSSDLAVPRTRRATDRSDRQALAEAGAAGRRGSLRCDSRPWRAWRLASSSRRKATGDSMSSSGSAPSALPALTSSVP